jgi:hypothetical protein
VVSWQVFTRINGFYSEAPAAGTAWGFIQQQLQQPIAAVLADISRGIDPASSVLPPSLVLCLSRDLVIAPSSPGAVAEFKDANVIVTGGY